MIAAIIALAIVCLALTGVTAYALRERGRDRADSATDAQTREARFSKERDTYLLRIGELENRLFSHTWQDFAQLQNTVSGAPERQSNLLREAAVQAAKARANGLDEDEVISKFLADQGVFTGDGSVLP